MKTNLLLVFLVTSLLSSTSNGQNLIPNGSFENDFTNWNNLVGGTGAATFSIDANDKVDGAKAMKVVVTTAGANAYDIQSINSPWASASGDEYTLSFYAKADAAGKTLRVVQQTNTYAQQDFSLTTTWQKYEWTFTAQEANLQLRFNFPATGTFNIDQVSIPDPVPVTVANLIQNGSFEKDFTNWNNLVSGTGAATFSIDTNDKVDSAKAMKVVVTAAGANAYDIQSINSPWASASGKEYTLSFYAKADVAGKTLRVVQQTNTYAQRDFSLTTAWQRYEWVFTAQEANLQLRFNFPVTGTFNIDQVLIPAPVPPSVINLIPNGGFENNFTNWTNLVSAPASAAFSIETVDKVQGSKAMKVAVATAGANAYDVQSINSAWASESGKEYTLSFYAKADVAGKTLRVVQQTNTYAQRDFSLTAAWEKYEWIFTAQEANLQLRFNFPVAGTFLIDSVSIPGAGTVVTPPPPYTPPGPPIATGKSKFLGSVHSPTQKVNFAAYFNQVTPENGGKWGAVEGTRNVMNWADLDSAYKLAKDNGFPFKMHTLIWGSQQPTWIETLDAATQLAEIKEWFQAVATRYPAIDFIEVVNEPLHAKPDAVGRGNYMNALGGNGATGWDWVINSFKLARQYFPNSKLWINDYSIINSSQSTATYMQIINLLKAENLIDGVGEQAHAFTTTASNATMLTNLNTLATSGLPLYATELDIDGPPAETPQGNAIQLQQYQRIFPLFWEHPAVKGVTLWGHRPGHWRTAEGAPLTYTNGAEKPAMEWLKQYIKTETVTEPAPLTATATEGTISCNGGTTTVTITATGGTPPYSGTGTFTVNAGPYSYTVTDSKSRSTTVSGTITEPAILTASSTSGSIACFGATTTVSVNATGGTAPYTGTGTFTVSAGSYTYTVTDSKGCTTSTSITVSQPSALTASVADVFAVKPGGSANTIYIGYGPTSVTLKVVPTGATPSYTYSWKLGTSATVIGTGQSLVVSPSIAGAHNYTVTVTDSKGCNVSVTKSIKVVDVRCGNNKVTICKVPPGNPSKYQTECVKNCDVAAALSKGSYLGSCVNSNTIVSAKSRSIPEVSGNEVTSASIRVFPNPSDGNFKVILNNAKAGKAQIVFMDVRGMVIATKAIEKVQGLQNVIFPHRNLASGMYIIKVVTEDAVQTLPVIIAH